MTTLIDKELFEYLDNLESEVEKRISTSNEGSLQHLMHSQMKGIIAAERDFLKYVNSNGTQSILSISPNGLPSVASLNPDLEKICELAEDEKSFLPIAQKYKKGISGKNKGENGHIYVPVSEGEWSKELASRSKEKLQAQIGFAVSETDDGKFELALREDIYLQGYDQHSKDFPILIREGKMRYHVVWNRLVEDGEESFYVPNTELVLQGQPTEPSEKKFDNIKRFYGFKKSDFKGLRKPWFISWRREAFNYASFLAAGTNARFRITENILEVIGSALEKRVIVKGIRKDDPGQTLAFAAVPFKNAPKTTPKKEDFYKYEEKSERKFVPKYQTTFDLVFVAGGNKMGEIEYILPHDEKVGGGYNDSIYLFTKGGIKLIVLGDSICNEEQYHNLQKGLKNLEKAI